MRVRLDVLLQDEPGKEAQRQSPLTVLQIVQVDSIDDLIRWHKDICKMTRILAEAGGEATQRYVLMIRKSFDSPCPMNMHPLSTSRRSFLYTTLSGVNVYLVKLGSRSPTVVPPLVCADQSNSARHRQRRLTLDPREFRQIVHNDLARMNVVVNERHALLRPVSSQHGHASER